MREAFIDGKGTENTAVCIVDSRVCTKYPGDGFLLDYNIRHVNGATKATFKITRQPTTTFNHDFRHHDGLPCTAQSRAASVRYRRRKNTCTRQSLNSPTKNRVSSQVQSLCRSRHPRDVPLRNVPGAESTPRVPTQNHSGLVNGR